MQVAEVKGQDVSCVIKNTATLAGSLFTLHISQIHIDLPTLSDTDKDVSSVYSNWFLFNNCLKLAFIHSGVPPPLLSSFMIVWNGLV